MNAVNWLIFRSMTFSIAIFYQNLINGCSGQQPIETMVYALINVNMTPIVIGMYIVFEVDLNNAKYATSLEAENLMPYNMSDLYEATRKHVNRFYSTHLAFVVMAFFTGAVIFLVYFMSNSEGGILGSDGKN